MKRNIPTLVLVALVCCATFCGMPASASVRADLVGFWHDDQCLGDSWGDRYVLFEDGRFEFHFHQQTFQTSEINRLCSFKGTWEADTDTLTLYVSEVKVLLGGVVTGHEMYELFIEDGVYATAVMPEPVKITYTLDEVTMDPDLDFRNGTVTIGGWKFWKWYSELTPDILEYTTIPR